MQLPDNGTFQAATPRGSLPLSNGSLPECSAEPSSSADGTSSTAGIVAGVVGGCAALGRWHGLGLPAAGIHAVVAGAIGLLSVGHFTCETCEVPCCCVPRPPGIAAAVAASVGGTLWRRRRRRREKLIGSDKNEAVELGLDAAGGEPVGPRGGETGLAVRPRTSLERSYSR